MSKSLKLIPVGSSTGMILPEDVLAHLGVGRGDSVQIVETPEGTYLRAHDPQIERQFAATRDVSRRRRKALRELAK